MLFGYHEVNIFSDQSHVVKILNIPVDSFQIVFIIIGEI